MNVIQNLVPQSKWGLKCPNPMTATRIVIHNTANDASARNEIQYMISNSNVISYHYAIDDKEVVQGVLETRNAWHAGDGHGPGNRQGIGIEICYSKSGGKRFEDAEKLTAKFVAYKLKEKGWGIDKVTKHNDYRPGGICPHRTLQLGWQRFLDMVAAELDTDVYTVVAGDTLAKIGVKLGIEWGRIATLNNILPPHTIKTGDKLMIPKAEQECKDCAALKGEIKVLQDKTSQEIKALNSQIGTITKELNARDVDLSNVKKENLVLKSSLTSLDSSTKKEIEMLNATAKLLEKEVELARENNLVLKETNLSLRVEIDRILGEQQECSIPRKIFECERTGDYIIYLTKGYSLYIDETEAE